jgi:hypothetical protein
MDDRRFDALAIRVGASRRSLLKKIVGIGGATALARLGLSDTHAARRGYSEPSLPIPPLICRDPISGEYLPITCQDTCCVCCPQYPGETDYYLKRFLGCLRETDRGCEFCTIWSPYCRPVSGQ